MALLLYTFLALATLIAGTTSRLLDPDKRSTLTPVLSLLPTSEGRSIVLLNSTLNVSGLWTDCFESEKHNLDPDQCMNALVNSEFASLPPNEVLEFASRSTSQSARLIGLPRRYLSCTYRRAYQGLMWGRIVDHALTSKTTTADGRCAIEPYLQPEALIAHATPRGLNQAVNRLNHDCVNDHINAGGFISGIGISGCFSFIRLSI